MSKKDFLRGTDCASYQGKDLSVLHPPLPVGSKILGVFASKPCKLS